MEDDRRRQESQGPAMNSNMVTTIAFSALKQLGLVHSPEEWNQMLNEIDPDRSKGYANMNLSDALKLIQAKGGDLSKIDFAKLGEEVNMQMDYGKMMDAVRAQQAQQIMQQQGLPVSGPVSQNGFPEMLVIFSTDLNSLLLADLKLPREILPLHAGQDFLPGSGLQ